MMMKLFFNPDVAKNYTNPAQISRVLTEHWLSENGYCPQCGTESITPFPNNNPVGDFFCLNCTEQFELKSKNAVKVGNIVADGAYKTMLERIQADNNPNFFFLSYRKADYSVRQLMVVPKHFFRPQMIIRRNPLSKTAKRAGLVSCNINMGMIPDSGKIFLVNHGQIIATEMVRQQWQRHLFLRAQKTESKGWLLAMMSCLDALPDTFNLAQVYAFERSLHTQFPLNHHIKDKIRQQLQILRDKGLIEFAGRGHYQKTAVTAKPHP